jgi:hypothetical protein
MFLRANARTAGLVCRGEPYQADYAAAFDGPAIVGVAAHCWNGMLLMQAPECAADFMHEVPVPAIRARGVQCRCKVAVLAFRRRCRASERGDIGIVERSD